jgi:hypothetical protein
MHITQLNWVLSFVKLDKTRWMAADYHVPVIVTYEPKLKQYLVVDGVHRLMKASNNGRPVIQTKFIDYTELQKARIK